MHPDNSKKWLHASFAVAALLSLFVFYPSFYHIPRADQIFYLAETADTHDWYSLAIKNYALNRTRILCPGDESVFRPIFYFILGTEKWMFRYSFIYWQITAFLFHLLVLWWMLKLLLYIRKNIFAPLLAITFSFLTVSMEAVVWQHISSYLVFTACVFAALYHLLLNSRETTSRMRHI